MFHMRVIILILLFVSLLYSLFLTLLHVHVFAACFLIKLNTQYAMAICLSVRLSVAYRSSLKAVKHYHHEYSFHRIHRRQHASADDAGMSKHRLSSYNAYYHNWQTLNFTASDSSSDERCVLKVLIVLRLMRLMLTILVKIQWSHRHRERQNGRKNLRHSILGHVSEMAADSDVVTTERKYV